MIPNHFIYKLKWETETKEFSEMKTFYTDCYGYVFHEPLTYEEQSAFLSFLDDADNLNRLTPVDFCHYFLERNIKFDFTFRYCKTLNPYENYIRYRVVKEIRRELDRLHQTASE